MSAAEEKAAEDVKAETTTSAEQEEKSQTEAKEEGKEESTGQDVEETKEEGQGDAKEEGNEESKEPEPEEAKELEENDPVDDRAKVSADGVAWSPCDATLNVLPMTGGQLFTSMTEGGCQYLMAGMRSTAGVKAGRYMFELKIVEALYPWEPQGSQSRTPHPRNLVRIGVSLTGTSLFLADSADSICFDSEGYLFEGKKRSRVSEKFWRDQTVGLLVNLDSKSPNANTVSLFRDGVRVSQPQKLPENMVGKALYPTVTYKNVMLHVNLGPSHLAPLPFSCRMLRDAAAADVECKKASQDSICEVVFPVGLPDQGVFDFVDSYLEQHPHHVELSNRKVLEWANKSGIWRPKGYSQRSSNDKPDMGFGIPLIDEGTIQGSLQAFAPALKRDVVVMELKGNLLAEERKKALARFGGSSFKRKAVVLMGEPPAEYKKRVQDLIMSDKKAQLEAEKRKKAGEEERNRLLEEKRKKAEEAKKSREAKNNGKEEEKKDETMGEEEEAQQDEAKKGEEDAEEKIELTEEEKQLWFRKLATPDLNQSALAKNYARFSLPTAEEGFDDISFVWQPKEKCEVHLRDWLLEQKRTQRAEDLEPSAWFKAELDKWKKSVQSWKVKQSEFKDPVKRKQAQKKKEAEAKKDGESAEGEKEEETKAEPMESNLEDLDVDSVTNVMDIGTADGEPLFSKFTYEDWTLLATRFELHLLIHAFRKDLNDPDRPSFCEPHLAYYYDKYYGKSFKLNNFGIEKFEDFIEMLEDTLCLSEGSNMLESKLPEDVPHDKFVKLAEEHRRDRARRVDAGDETAELKFKKPAPPPPRQPTRDERDRRGSDKGDKGKGKSSGRDSDRGKGGRPAYGGSNSSAPPPSRYASSRNDGYSSNSGGTSRSAAIGGGSSYGSQKRSYGSSSHPPSKQSRPSSSYNSSGGGYSRR